MKTEQLYIRLAEAIRDADETPGCQTSDPEAFFPEVGQNFATTLEQRWAVEICNRCPVKTECGEYAIAANEQWGLWGGLTPRERQQIRNKGRGRPKLK